MTERTKRRIERLESAAGARRDDHMFHVVYGEDTPEPDGLPEGATVYRVVFVDPPSPEDAA